MLPPREGSDKDDQESSGSQKNSTRKENPGDPNSRRPFLVDTRIRSTLMTQLAIGKISRTTKYFPIGKVHEEPEKAELEKKNSANALEKALDDLEKVLTMMERRILKLRFVSGDTKKTTMA